MSPAAVVVEVVVHLLRKRPHHRVRAETRHPVAREAVNRGGIVGELLVHRRGEEELGVRMDEAPVGDVLVVAVSELEAGDVGSVHLAVRDVELRADGLGLEDCEALRRAPVDDVLEVGCRTRRARVRAGLVDLLLVEAPVRVAEVEERRAVRVGEVLLALRDLHESAPVDFEVACVGLCLQRARLAAKCAIALAGGDPAPAAGLRGREAHAEGLAAVPEAGTRHLLAGFVREHGVERHGVRASGVIVRARLEDEFRRTPHFDGHGTRGVPV